MKLLINKADLNLKETEVFWNIDFCKTSLDFMVARPPNIPVITLFKETFGRQLTCKILGSESRRFFIWTFQPEEQQETIIYALVHNAKGVVYEYPKKSRKDKIPNVIEEVRKRILLKYKKHPSNLSPKDKEALKMHELLHTLYRTSKRKGNNHVK